MLETNDSQNISIVFLGSGPVAAQSLHLLQTRFSVEAVITKPSTAKEMEAAAPDIPLYPVNNRTELDELLTTKSFTSRVAILIDFGIIISRTAIDSFPLGIINSHFSLLPEWRGADPISFAILSGQTKTGVSLMLLDEGMDTGKILVTKSLPIDPKDTTPSLTDKLIVLSDSLLREHVPRHYSGNLQSRQQSHPGRATYSRKLTKDDGIIDWTKSAEVLEREIRAFNGWPKSRTMLGNKEVIITAAHTTPNHVTDTKPGDIEIRGAELGVGTTKGVLWIDKIKPAGKNEMTAAAFLAGYRHSL